MTNIKRGFNKLISSDLRHEQSFTILLVLAFFLVGIIGIVRHEMWLDELHAWMIARDSVSLSNLLSNSRYELHPKFWHLCLYVLSRFSHNPVVMQIFHLMLATGVIYTFAKFSPFTKVQKVLFSLGYFPFYEYAIISRNYVLGILFIFLFCAFFQTRTKSYIILSIFLGILSNTSVYGLIIALTLGGTLLVEYFFFKRSISFLLFPKKKLDITISILIFTLGIVVAIYQVIPPPDSAFKANWLIGLHKNAALGAIATIWRSYVPIPNFFTYNFWNTNLLIEGLSGSRFSYVLSLGLFVFCITLFLQKPIALFLYLSGTFGMLLFTYCTQYGGFFLRHHGHLFILFIASLWISSYYNQSQISIHFLKRMSIFSNKYKTYFILTLLCVHLTAGLFVFSMDLLYPFSANKEVAEFIENQQLNNKLIVGNYIASPISAYLDKKIYFLETQQLGSFTLWTKSWIDKRWDKHSHLKSISKVLTLKQEGFLLILDYDFPSKTPNFRLKKIAEFNNSIVLDHGYYYLYLVSPH